MISVRQFCREPGYPITLFLTYSFDPLFFERIALADLEVGGSRRIIVVGDGHQIEDAVRRCAGQLAHLGRRYLLAETTVSNTFHPKLIARLAPEAGRVWIGSGNLTFTGWGGNRELGAAWSVGPGQDDDGAWLEDVFEAVGTLVSSRGFAAQLETVRRSVPWLKASTGASRRPNVLLGMPRRPLGPQLAERWKGRRFNELMLCTGSTDAEGAFLRWAHQTFGIERATICLTPAFASFEPELLSKLPIELRIVKCSVDELMHAKAYWFSGPNGDAAVMGSANCSAAAWLASGANGNVELLVAYDDADRNDFAAVLDVFDAPKLEPAKALPTKPQIIIEPTREAGFRLVSLRLLPSGGFVEAIVEPAAAEHVMAKLVVGSGSRTRSIPANLQGTYLRARLPPDLELGSLTAFCSVEIVSGASRYRTNIRWLDNEAALERAAHDQMVDPGLRDLSRPSLYSSDQQKVIEAVYAVSAQLLNPEQTPAVASKISKTASEAKGSVEAEASARAVDPSAIIRSLKELRVERQVNSKRASSIYTGTLEGVIAQLFSHEPEERIDLSQETWTGEADKGLERASDLTPTDSATPPPPTASEVIIRFREQIDSFLHELARSQFAETCDANRMVQALAFPLFLCARGIQAEWLPERISASVAARVTEIMFHRSYGPGIPVGLLHRVQHRYAAASEGHEFLKRVGDGTLWSALLASLSLIESHSLKQAIQCAAAIGDVMNCRELLAAGDAEQLSVLIPGLIIKDAENAISVRAPRIADALAGLASYLTAEWDAIEVDQGGGRAPQPGGAVLWSPSWGWRILPRLPALNYCSGYINVEKAATNSRAVRVAIDALLAAAASSAVMDRNANRRLSER